MARIFVNQATVTLSMSLHISEPEARALDALTGYNFEEFMRVFKTHLGESYMKGHEDALKSFFSEVRQSVPGILSRAQTARELFNGGKTPKKSDDKGE